MVLYVIGQPFGFAPLVGQVFQGARETFTTALVGAVVGLVAPVPKSTFACNAAVQFPLRMNEGADVSPQVTFVRKTSLTTGADAVPVAELE